MESHRTRVFMENLPRRACAAPWAYVSALGAQVIVAAVLALPWGQHVPPSFANRPSIFFSLASSFLGAASHGPEHAGGFRWRWDLARLQRPSSMLPRLSIPLTYFFLPRFQFFRHGVTWPRARWGVAPRWRGETRARCWEARRGCQVKSGFEFPILWACTDAFITISIPGPMI